MMSQNRGAAVDRIREDDLHDKEIYLTLFFWGPFDELCGFLICAGGSHTAESVVCAAKSTVGSGALPARHYGQDGCALQAQSSWSYCRSRCCILLYLKQLTVRTVAFALSVYRRNNTLVCVYGGVRDQRLLQM